MDVPEVLLLITLYVLVIAAVGTLIFFAARRPRPSQRGLPVPNVSGLNLTPLGESIVGSWLRKDETAEAQAHASLAEPATIDAPMIESPVGRSSSFTSPPVPSTLVQPPMPVTATSPVAQTPVVEPPVTTTAPVLETPAMATTPHVETPVMATAPVIETPVMATAPVLETPASATTPDIESTVRATTPDIATPVTATTPDIEAPDMMNAPVMPTTPDIQAPVMATTPTADAPNQTAAMAAETELPATAEATSVGAADVPAILATAPTTAITPAASAPLTPTSTPTTEIDALRLPPLGASSIAAREPLAAPASLTGAPTLRFGLSDAFAANGLLPEGLRTLEVNPARVIEPGVTVRATFTFRNPGGGVASGFRVRFRMPGGLAYVPDSARIDETPIEDIDGTTSLLHLSGADIGEIPAQGERRISLEFVVASTIENGTSVAIQAAVASADVSVIGSNIARLVVRSLPVLENDITTMTLSPVREATPGEELQLTACVHNSGQSSAHDLMVLLPLPAHTTFVPNSISIDGRSFLGGGDNVPFGFARPTVVTKLLEPGATINVAYRVRIDTPLEDETRIVAHGAVCSNEVSEFSLAPVTLRIPSAASFGGDDTSLWIDCSDDVEPGERVRIVLHAKNTGTAPARKLSLRIALPEGLVYTAGSLAIDDAPAPDRGAVPDAIRLGDLEPGRSVELALSAIVQSPIANGHELRLTGNVVWSKGQRKFERTLTARSAPRFPANFNRIEREMSRRVNPGDAVAYTVALENMGTDVATDVRLQIASDIGLEHLRIGDRETEILLGDGGTIALDNLQPGVSRMLRIEGRVARIIEDQTQLRLYATLLTAQVARVELGAPVHVVDSSPAFSLAASQIIAESDEALRLKRARSCRLVLVNEGTDTAHDVHVALQLPDELRLERVENGSIDGNWIMLGEIPAGETREARLHLRMVGSVSGDSLKFSARVGGLNVVPFGLRQVELATHAEASFAEGATLLSQPPETIDAGDEVNYTLTLRNSGDGAAKRLAIRLSSLTNAVYAQGSTTINGVALQDRLGTSLLLSDDGLLLADVGAGVEVVAGWRVIVNVPLPPETIIDTSAAVTWDDAPMLSVAAPPISVRSSSALPVIEPQLPFSVLGAIAAPATHRSPMPAARQEAVQLQPAYQGLRPAVPVRGNGKTMSTIEYVQLAPGEDTRAIKSEVREIE